MPSISASTNSSPASEDAPTFARDKFGNQKAISSDEYFERGAYDAGARAEAHARLAQFAGATAISSDQYFGRERERGEAERRDRGERGEA